MRNKPLVSIIVPVYNAEKYLHECLDSIAAQTYTNWECILVDDGSTDSSGNICDQYCRDDSRFKVTHKKNAGENMARKSGFEASSGEYITFSDDDDVLHSKYLEILTKLCLENDADISRITAQKFTAPPPEQFSSVEIPYTKVADDKMKIIQYLLPVKGVPGVNFVMWGALYRRQLFQNIDWEISNVARGGDLPTNLQAHLNAKRYAFSPVKLYFYRQISSSASRNFHSHNYNTGEQMERMSYIDYLHDTAVKFFAKYALDLTDQMIAFKLWQYYTTAIQAYNSELDAKYRRALLKKVKHYAKQYRHNAYISDKTKLAIWIHLVFGNFGIWMMSRVRK